MSDVIRVNGNALSWGSLYFKIDGERYYGLTSISYSDRRERVKGWGMGKHHAPQRRSRGKYTPDAVKIVGWKGSVQTIRQALANAAGTTSYGDYEFQCVLEGVEKNEQALIVEIEDCVWDGNTANHEENPDPLKEEFTLDCMGIRRNGLTLWDASEGTPI